MYFEIFKYFPVRAEESYKIKVTNNQREASQEVDEEKHNYIYVPTARNTAGTYYQIHFKTNNNGTRNRPLSLKLTNKIRSYMEANNIDSGDTLFTVSRLKKQIETFLKDATGDEKLQPNYLRHAMASEHPESLDMANAMNHNLETHKTYVRVLKDAR